LGRYIAATGASCPDALAQSVTELTHHGAAIHAVKAAVTRAMVLRHQGAIDQSVTQAHLAWQQAADLGEDCPGLFYRLGHAVGLNPREREIALLVGGGVTSPTIAARLDLSTRTVENTLYTACRKVGTRGREELHDAVTSWAALPPRAAAEAETEAAA
jgi:DNA-binding CsgD family transcriptional regulator